MKPVIVFDKQNINHYHSRMSEADPYSPKQFFKKHLVKTIITIFVLVLAGVSFFFFNQYQTTKALLQSNGNTANSDKSLIAQVGKLFELPADEDPAIATVSDKSKLSDQPFFAKAENGDKVLIYKKAKIAILFRPKINKIIQVSSVNLTENGTTQSQNAASVAATTKNISVAVYNGTTTTGLAKSAGQKITSGFPTYSVLTKDASTVGYENTIVIDISGRNSKISQDLITLLGGKIESQLPSGETKPNTDILVILGADYSVK